MSLKLIRVCDTCGAEHEQEDVYPDTRLREYMGRWACSNCLVKRSREFQQVAPPPTPAGKQREEE